MGEVKTKVWCLLGKKAGDNTQVRALAGALGLACEEKHISARPWELLVHCGIGATLSGIDRAGSSPLEAPWPDLVISAGRRNEPVAQWIKQQAAGRTRLVHMGRPWVSLDKWDLLITTPQYFLPEQDNVLHNSLPLHESDPARRNAAAADWEPRFESLPRPWIAVLVGGDSGRFVMTAGKGARLGNLANALATRTGGSLLVTDSARTPQVAGDALEQRLGTAHFCHRVARGGENPYRGFLALADAFVVTGESMSMLGEASATGKPLFIFDVGDGPGPWWRHLHNFRYKPLTHRLAMRFGPDRMRRDVGKIQDALVSSGRAGWLDEAAIATASQLLVGGGEVGSASERADTESCDNTARLELNRAAEAVRRLLIPR